MWICIFYCCRSREASSSTMLCRSTARYTCSARDFNADVNCDYEEDCVLMHSALEPITLAVIMQKKQNRLKYHDTRLWLFLDT